MQRSLVKPPYLVMSLSDPKPEPNQQKAKTEDRDDETVALFVEWAMLWSESLFPDDPTEKLDDIIAGNLFITFGIHHKKTRDILCRLHKRRKQME